MTTPNPNHPAKFSAEILAQLRVIVRTEAKRLGRQPTVLDPFAGVGRIHDLADIAITTGVELEPEWAACRAGTIVGNALDLPAGWTQHFDIVATSPVYPNRMCLAQEQRLLTADLHWLPAGDVHEGERLLAFDEIGTGVKMNGHTVRRKWRVARVEHSEAMDADCVRVQLADGTAVVCTADHPWLTRRAHTAAVWVEAQHLLRFADRPSMVLKQVEPWSGRRSTYEAGWLAGMFDGEGSLSFGQHGAPKLILTQAEGETADLIRERLIDLGYEATAYTHEKREGRRPVLDFHVGGGFPEILRVLGELRPERLITKLDGLQFESRSIQPWGVQVVAVEPVGVSTIQSIATSTGTYIGEGFLMHNTDHHNPKDKCKRCDGEGKVGDTICPACKGKGLSTRRGYKFALGRDPSEGSAAILKWGDAYRGFHRAALVEMIRVTDEGGLVVVNMSNHYQSVKQAGGAYRSVLMRVVEWWVETMLAKGLFLEAVLPVATSRMREGANYNLRAGVEQVIVMRKPWPIEETTP